MDGQYVETRDGGYFIAGSRVSLDSVVYAFLRGESPEGILESFPALTLEQVFGSLAYYTAHRQEIDDYLAASRAEFEKLREEWRKTNPALYARLVEARTRLASSSPRR
jgi:uncharacterized protein (DUF433 family)